MCLTVVPIHSSRLLSSGRASCHCLLGITLTMDQQLTKPHFKKPKTYPLKGEVWFEGLNKLDVDQALKKLCYCIWSQYGGALGIVHTGCMFCLSKQIRFLPEDPCQLLSSYSSLCFFSHNNQKHLCVVNYSVRLRKAPIISIEPQQKRFSSAPENDS